MARGAELPLVTFGVSFGTRRLNADRQFCLGAHSLAELVLDHRLCGLTINPWVGVSMNKLPFPVLAPIDASDAQCEIT
jgi:hypothetical protein